MSDSYSKEIETEKQENPKLAAALEQAGLGLHLFPLVHNGKKPWRKGWQAKSTTDPEQLRKWFTYRADYNIGVDTEKSGLVVYDTDQRHEGIDGNANLMALAGEHARDLDDTRKTESPTGSFHRYFKGEPVASKNGVLAPGVDVKSRGGYVVGAGSVINGKRYRVVNSGPIKDHPQWAIGIIANAYTARPEKTRLPMAVELDTDAAIAQAIAYLATAPVSVEGHGGNDNLFRVAAKLKDIAVSEGTAVDCLDIYTEWNQNCCPPWEPDELAEVVSHAYAYGENSPGVASIEMDFDIIPADWNADNDNGDPRTDNPFLAGRIRYDDYRLDLSPDYLVKGLLDQGTLSVMYGAPKSGKTFAALDIAHHIARGADWRGLRVKQASVIYLSMEGGKKLLNRVEVLKQRHPGALPNFDVWPRPVDFRDPKIVKQLIEYQRVVAEENPDMPRLIVVDTVARAMAGADENSAKDMGAFVRAVDKVREATGAHVLLIHHSGKDEARGMRGSSALLGAIDHELHVQYDAETGVRTIKSGVQRDLGPSKEGFSFKLAGYGIGIDADEDPVTSCYCQPCEAPAKTKGDKLSRAEVVVLDVLQELGPAPVNREDWKKACVNRDDLCDSDKPRSRKDTFNRAVSNLSAKKLICKDGVGLYQVENGEAFADNWDAAA